MKKKFFMPAITDAEKAEELYHIAKKFAYYIGYDLSEQRVYSITYNHNGVELILWEKYALPITKL